MQIKRCFPALLAGLAAGLLLGCQNDEEIRHYQASRAEAPPLNRLLGAIFPKGEASWFIKLVGPAPLVEEHKAEFDQFVDSIRLTDKGDQPITWTVPNGWRAGPKSEMRYASFSIGPEDHPLDLSVSTSGGTLLDNVNRWRGQMKLGPLTEAGLTQEAKRIDVEGVKVTLVDMEGRGTGKTRMGGAAPMAGGAPPSPHGAAPRRPIQFAVPAGWTEDPAGGMRVAAFHISEGGQSAEVTVIPLPGDVGGVLANVKRWRDQVGLKPASDTEVAKEMQQLTVDGTPSTYVDLLGPESAGSKRHMLAVMVPRGGQTWFIKMVGPAELVSKHKAAFEAFAKSVRFEGEPGARP